MRVLITGGKGYIGNYLSNFLSEKFDIYKSDIDLNCYQEVIKLIVDMRPEFIVHCAGTSSVSTSIKNPLSDFDKNVLTTRNILEAVRLYSPNSHIVYLSSAAVYGNPVEMPIKENTQSNPISPYGYHKVSSELLIKEYTNIFNIKTSILRIFSVFGNGMKKQVVYDIYNKFYDNNSNEVSLLGTGSETRDFIHIIDVCRVIELMINNQLIDTFNVSSGQSVSIKYLAESIKNIMQSEKEIVFSGKNRSGDPSRWEVSIAALNKIGFETSITLEEGLREYNEWFKNEIN